MTSLENTASSPSPSREFALQVIIAVLAVTAAALFVTNSVFAVLAVAVLLAVTAILKFDWFVYAVVFCLPWNPPLDVNIPVKDVALLVHVTLFLCVGIRIIRRHKSIRQWLFGSRLKKAVLIFLAVAVISLLLPPFHGSQGAVRSLARLFSYVALFFAVIGWVETREQVSKIVKVILVSTICVALFGLYQALVGGYTDLYFRLYPLQETGLDAWTGRVTSFLFHFNALAGYLNLAIPFAIGALVLSKDRWVRYAGTICLGTAGAALFLTGSRGGMIAYAGIIFASIWFLTPRRVTVLRIIPAIVLSALLVVALVRPHEAERLQEVDEFTQVSRLALWGAAGVMFLGHPVLGVGYGNYPTLYSDYVPGSSEEIDSHDLYLQFLAETGIIGFLAFFTLIGSFLWIAVKLVKMADPLCRIVGIGVGGAILATLVHGVVDYLFNGSPQFGTLFWVVLALGFVTFKTTREQNL
ncbi:MAG TPA: O-antigen ligase family protein [Candidatus Angelobacter sp.]|nr:O-antigen ligase family protein [Candidatus Angelobacter sp.]